MRSRRGPARARAAARGFTLIELVTAIAIFGVLAAMLFQMTRGALQVWRVGEGNRAVLEKGTVLLDEMAAELRMARAYQPPGDAAVPVRMLADFALLDLDKDDVDESLLQRFRMVRSCPEERFDERLRRGGTVPGAAAYASDLHASEAPTLAPAGLAEVAYFATALPAKGADPALLTLYRVFRSPIGGDHSLFGGTAFARPDRLPQGAVELAGNVLFLGFEFWSRDTRSWGEATDSEFGPLAVWDSTRGHLLDEGTFNSFALRRGPDSLLEESDDVFPRAIRVTLTLARDEDEAAVVRLAADVSPAGRSILVNNARAFEEGGEEAAGGAGGYLKIDGEWLAWKPGIGNEVRVERARRSTAALGHKAGTRVWLGRTFERIVELPVYRESWNDS